MARRKLPRHQDQLEQALRMAFAEAQEVAIESLRSGRSRGPYFAAREALAERLAATMILYCGGDKRRAARWLGVSYSTIKQLAP